jgi:hypothetical protein
MYNVLPHPVWLLTLTPTMADIEVKKSTSSGASASKGLELLASFPVPLKALLLIIFCFTQFLDAFNNSSFLLPFHPLP